MQNKIIVAGIGPGGEDFITPAALKKIRAAKFLVGGRRALNDFAVDGQITCPITRDLDTAIDFIRDKLNLGDVVVIVSGDPGYYSMLDTLRKNFPPPSIEVLPSISAIQLAFAKLSLPWHGATLLSFHGRQPARAALQFTAGKVLGLLTDAENNSATISRLLIGCGWAGDSRVTICDKLSYPDEKIFTTTLAEAAQSEAVKHCVLIVQGAENFTGATQNLIDANVNRLLEIFPTCATEIQGADGKLHAAVNFDALRQILDTRLVEGREAYIFDFVGKKRAKLEAHAPIRKTLRPLREKSRDFDTTANLYIEGDNLDALKILAESYLGRVKLIYIDPPYNTGNDFIYRDDFTQAEEDFDDAAGNIDLDGNKLRANPSSGGRFHSDWCAMIYSRLLIAKHFLAQDGVIFISIDDHEQANLKKICDEVFGEKNFVAQCCVKRSGGRQDSKFFAVVNEYLICYAKNIQIFAAGEDVKLNDSYPKFDAERGRHYKTQLLRKWGANSRRVDRPNLFYPIPAPDGSELYPMLSATEEGCWRWGKDKMHAALDDGLIEFVRNGDAWIAYEKIYQPLDGEANTKKFTTWLDESFAGSDAVKNLLGDKVFPYPKAVDLIKRALQMGGADEDSIVMDFFSGSATTAHAVMELNAQDGGHRQFIMIQLAESTPENSEAYRAGYRTICDIGQERIRRAGDKLKADNPDLDAGFRVFKVDSSNFIDPPAVWTQDILQLYIDNIKADRDALDLLFGALLDSGKTIDRPLTHELLDGFNVFTYDNDVMACFDAKITEEVFHKLAARRPSKIFFRDVAFATSADKINALEYFSYFAPDTEVKVL